MKQYIQFLLVTLSMPILCSYHNNVSSEKIISAIVTDPKKQEILRKYPKLEKASLCAVFYHQNQLSFFERYMSKENALHCLTREKSSSTEKYNAGLIHYYDGNLIEAQSCFEKSEEPEAYYMRAQLLLANPQSQESFQTAREYLIMAEHGGYHKAEHALKKLDLHLSKRELAEPLQEPVSTLLENIPCVAFDITDALLSTPASKTGIKKVASYAQKIKDCTVLLKYAEKQDIYDKDLVPFLIEKTLIVAHSLSYKDYIKTAYTLLNTMQKHNPLSSAMIREHTPVFSALLEQPYWKKLEEISTSEPLLQEALAFFYTSFGSSHFIPGYLTQALSFFLQLDDTDFQSLVHQIHSILPHAFAAHKQYDAAYNHLKQLIQTDQSFLDTFGFFILDYMNMFQQSQYGQNSLQSEAIHALVQYSELFPHKLTIEQRKKLLHIMVMNNTHKHCNKNQDALPEQERMIRFGQASLRMLSQDTHEEASAKYDIAQSLIYALLNHKASQEELEECLSYMPISRHVYVIPSLIKNNHFDLAQKMIQNILSDESESQKTTLAVRNRDRAHYWAALLESDKGNFLNALIHLSSIDCFQDYFSTIDKDMPLLHSFIDQLEQQTNRALQKPKNLVDFIDIRCLRFFGSIIIQCGENPELRNKIGLACQALKAAEEQGDIYSAIQIKSMRNAHPYEIIRPMLKKHSEGQYCLFKNLTQTEFIAYFKPVIKKILIEMNKDSLDFSALSILPAFFSDDYFQFMQLLSDLKISSKLHILHYTKQVPSPYYNAFLEFLNQHIATYEHKTPLLSDQQESFLQEALVFQWYMLFCTYKDTTHERDNLIEKIYASCSNWLERIPFSPAMTSLYNAIQVHTCRTTHSPTKRLGLLTSLSQITAANNDDPILKAASLAIIARYSEQPNTPLEDLIQHLVQNQQLYLCDNTFVGTLIVELLTHLIQNKKFQIALQVVENINDSLFHELHQWLAATCKVKRNDIELRKTKMIITPILNKLACYYRTLHPATLK